MVDSVRINKSRTTIVFGILRKINSKSRYTVMLYFGGKKTRNEEQESRLRKQRHK